MQIVKLIVFLFLDLKIPLAISSNALSALQDTGMELDQKRHLMTLKQTWRELGCAVNNAYIIIEKEKNALILNLTLENVESMINDVILIRGSELVGKDVVVMVDVDPTVPKIIKTDRLRICQIICNIMTRAIRFVPSGEGMKIKIGILYQNDIRFLEIYGIFDTTAKEITDRLCSGDPFAPPVVSGEEDFMNSGLDLIIAKVFCFLY